YFSSLLALSGVVIFVIVILLSTSLVRDILKREELSLKLEGSEKRYHFLFELSADGIVVADLNGIITDCNTAACKIFGYSKQELVGKSYHIIWPDELKHLLPAKISRDTVTGDRLIERTYVKKDGTILNAEVYTKLIEINGLSSVVAHVRDVTDKKLAQKAIAKSEEKYRNLFEKSLAGIFKATIEGQIIECNNEYLKVLGYDSIENIKKISTKSLYADPKDREKLVELLRKQREVKDYVMKLKKKDGSYVWVYDSVSLMYDEDLKKEVLFGTMVDITAQKEAEKEIWMLAHSLESISECVSITDENNIILYINDSFAKTYGYKREELIGQHISIVQPQSVISPDIQKEILDITNSGGWKGEILNKRRDGTGFPVYLSTSVIKDFENEPIALIGVAADITERKHAEESLRLSEEKFNKAFQSSPIAMSIQNNENLFVDVNNAFLKLTGFSREEVIGYRGKELQLWADATESKRANECFVANGVIRDFEFRFRKKTGETGIGIMSAESIVLDGKPASLSAVLDITERKHAEEALRDSELLFQTLAQNSPVGIFRTRADGYTTYVNPKWCQLSGMKADEALGDGWLKAVHPDDKDWLFDGWKSATDKKQSSVTEYRFIRPDGTTAWVMGQAIPELNSNGQIEGYVGTITDITNIKLYEHELIKAKETAENSERIKSEFLAQMSHEIRTPINVIVSSTSYLKDELEDKIEPELFTMFNSLDRAGKRIIRTVDLILNMAEIQTNSYHCTPMHLDISGRLLASVYNEFILSAKEKNLEFNLHRKTADAKVYADEYSVRQMFCQLIDNAIKYTHEGKVDLTVDKDAKGKVFISIADTGIGMSEEFMAQMYNPFTQEEQGYSRSFEGNGLGLALVKKYCDLNYATITVESAKGKGTVFTIKF
ncbi:MAG: PAS domain S-box protein, partial [Bacteroidetes bacterium]|nr:PAS domain S-box protein [Bacteroidota bacterium]